jgi:hypothetical protein
MRSYPAALSMQHMFIPNLNFRFRRVFFAAITATKNPAFHFGSRVANK